MVGLPAAALMWGAMHDHTFVAASRGDLSDAMWRSLRWTLSRAWGAPPDIHLERCSGCHEVRVTLAWPHTRRTISIGACQPLPAGAVVTSVVPAA